MQVPSGKTLYIGGRKFISGETVPSFIAPFLNFKEDESEQEIIIEPVKPKRKYNKRKK